MTTTMEDLAIHIRNVCKLPLIMYSTGSGNCFLGHTICWRMDSLFSTMKRSGVFVEGPVLYCTVFLLKREIIFYSFGNTWGNPYLQIPLKITISQEFPAIYLGNLVNFQSFIPDVDDDQVQLTSLRAVGDKAPSKTEAVCTESMRSVKYLFKYIFKGYDCINLQLSEGNINSHDEVNMYLDARHVSAPEAFWRL